MSAARTLDQVLAGDRRAVGRAITALENGDAAAYELRSALARHVGRAHVIGVTGPPGGGKSTLVAALIKALRARDRTVAVVAVDPSSPLTGGAVLGDRIRMGEHQADEGVFIRSLASRGHLGGLSRAAADAVDVFDAAGYDIVLVETVGAGQSEVEVTRLADTRLVVCPPGLGDDVQAIKAGVLEIADAFVVSKSDLPDAHKTEGELLAMLALRRGPAEAPPVLKTTALSGQGMRELVEWLSARPQRGTRHARGEQTAPRRLLGQLIQEDAYARHTGLELVSAALGTATVRMRTGEHHMNFNGRCHGGAIFSLADTALGLACNSYGTIATLIDSQLSIVSAVKQGEWLVAHAREISRSRKIATYRVEVRRGSDDGYVAGLNGTVYLLDKPVRPAAPDPAP